MAYKVNPDVCINCGACESACPVAAISEKDGKIAYQILKEIKARLHFLVDVGLDYLTRQNFGFESTAMTRRTLPYDHVSCHFFFEII